MSEEQQKNIKLMGYWLFSTVMIVFAAITTYIALWARPVGASMLEILRAGFPIWGITAVAAAIIYIGYTFYLKRNA